MTSMNNTASTPIVPTKRRGRPPNQPVRATNEGVPQTCIHRLDEKTRKAIERASRLLETCAVYRVEAMKSAGDVRAYLKMKMAGLEHEEFHAIWLDSQNRIIAFECLFVGTLMEVSVYPREVVKTALRHNAGAVIFAHNHPSGVAEHSVADKDLTSNLKQVLALVDVQVLDHFIIAGTSEPFSFAERGLL